MAFVIPLGMAEPDAWLMDTLQVGRIPFVKPWMIDRGDDHYELDIPRARTVVGWEPRHRLRESLPKVVAALKADAWAWYRENEIPVPAWLAGVAPQAPPGELSGQRLEELRGQIT